MCVDLFRQDDIQKGMDTWQKKKTIRRHKFSFSKIETEYGKRRDNLTMSAYQNKTIYIIFGHHKQTNKNTQITAQKKKTK